MVRKKHSGSAVSPDLQSVTIDQWWERRASIVSSYYLRNPASAHVPSVFTTPEQLWEAACEYFAWMESRPQLEEKYYQYKDQMIGYDVRKKRPFTLKGLLLFIDISKFIWYGYRNGKNEDYKRVCEMIDAVMFQQKFEGAVVDLFNASIIAREIGLADRQEVSGPDGGPINTVNSNLAKVDLTDLTDEQLDTIINAIDGHKKPEGDAIDG
jgi:hypothetical protein